MIDLSRLIEGEVSTTPADLAKYSEDASIFHVAPQIIAFPKNVDDLKHLVKFVGEHKNAGNNLSLTARSGGTDMGGGSLNESIILDMTRHFNHIGEFDAAGKTLVTEPGVYYRDIEAVTHARGLELPSYPASKMICTIGGMVANNSGGEKSLRYGQTKQYVDELQMVLADGEEHVIRPLSQAELEVKIQEDSFEGRIYRDLYDLIRDNYDLIQQHKPTTSKNSSGYFLWDVWDKEHGIFNLNKLLCGSQGTLGLITKIKLRLVRPQPKSKLMVMFLNDMSVLGDLVKTVMRYEPETFESYDQHAFSLAIKYLPGMIKQMKGNLFKLALQFLPELWLTISGGIPKLVLIAEFTGTDDAAILATMQAARDEVERKYRIKTHVTKSEAETQKYWTIRRESFNLLRQHTHGKQTAPFIDDIIVHPNQLPQFLPRLNDIFARYPHLIYTIAGHAGDANFHIIPIMDLRDQAQHEIITRLSHEVYDLVLQYGGSITAEHNDGLIRTPYVAKMFGPDMAALFARVKQIFDPQNIFNPRKKVGATEEYVLEHIKR